MLEESTGIGKREGRKRNKKACANLSSENQVVILKISWHCAVRLSKYKFITMNLKIWVTILKAGLLEWFSTTR